MSKFFIRRPIFAIVISLIMPLGSPQYGQRDHVFVIDLLGYISEITVRFELGPLYITVSPALST